MGPLEVELVEQMLHVLAYLIVAEIADAALVGVADGLVGCELAGLYLEAL